MTARWYVTKMDGTVDDIGAESYEIATGGVLLFRNDKHLLSIAYGPAAWAEVEFQGEDA